MNKCKYYNEWTWGEPPLDEGENGTLITEYECKNATGYFEATFCEGRKSDCNLPDNQNKTLLQKAQPKQSVSNAVR